MGLAEQAGSSPAPEPQVMADSLLSPGLVPTLRSRSWVNYQAACEDLFASILGLCRSGDSDSQSRTSAQLDKSWHASREPAFNPDRVLAHSFLRFKRAHFSLPTSRRRVIVLPPHQDHQDPGGPGLMPRPLAPLPQPPARSPPAAGSKELPPAGPDEQADRRAWLQRRLALRVALDSFGDLGRWLQRKPSCSRSEARVLSALLQEQPRAWPDDRRDLGSAKKSPRQIRLRVPRLQLPKPPALSVLFHYLHSHKIKILDLFPRPERTQSHRVSREEFIVALNMVGAPLSRPEVEDVVIYLGSLGKHNCITTDVLGTTYRFWALAQKRSETKERRGLRPVKPRIPHPCPRALEASPQPAPVMQLLTVPPVIIDESRPMSLEDMEEVGRRSRQRKRVAKMCVPSIQFSERCRLVRTGDRAVDEHCLPSTLGGDSDTEGLLDSSRRATFLVYLRCCQLCQACGLPLSLDVLQRALLYPGDKIVLQETQVRPLRQPGGYYHDLRLPGQKPDLSDTAKTGQKATEEARGLQEAKEMEFQEFEELVRKLKVRGSAASPQQTRPNSFWPGHLLDKLRLYLPALAPGSLALFQHVQPSRPVYPAPHHPHRWWPVKDGRYTTYGHYDGAKVYRIG